MIDTSENTVSHRMQVHPDPHCVRFSKSRQRGCIAIHKSSQVAVPPPISIAVLPTGQQWAYVTNYDDNLSVLDITG